MVRTITSFVFIVTFFLASGQENDKNLVVIPESYSSSFDQPAVYLRGQVLRIDCDSLYVLNSFTFNYFRDLKVIMNNQAIDCSEVIDLYKSTLKENGLLTERLLRNAKETGELNKDQYTTTKVYLDSAQKSLATSLEKIEKARLSVEKANKQVSRIKHKNTLEKILIGIGGVGIGILAGISLN